LNILSDSFKSLPFNIFLEGFDIILAE